VATAEEDGRGKPQGRGSMCDLQQRHRQGQGRGPEARDLDLPRECAKKGEGGGGGKGTRLGGDTEEDGGRGELGRLVYPQQLSMVESIGSSI